jgi:hypothetical protein
MKNKIAFLAIALLAFIAVGLATPINPGHRADTVGGTTSADREFPEAKYFFPGGIEVGNNSITPVNAETGVTIITNRSSTRLYVVTFNGNRDCNDVCIDFATAGCVSSRAIIGNGTTHAACDSREPFGVACECNIP